MEGIHSGKPPDDCNSNYYANDAKGAWPPLDFLQMPMAGMRKKTLTPGEAIR